MTTTLPTCFDTFLQNIEPAKEMKKHAQDAHKPVREHLEDDEEFGQYFESSFLYGSYARHTAVGNIKDVDIVVLTNFDPDNPEHTPKKALSKLKAALTRHYEDAKNTTYNRKSIQVLDPLPDEPDVEMTLDVIPAIAIGDEHGPLLVPDREDGEWVSSHPRAHLSHTSTLNDDNHGKQMFVPLVKIVKHWWAYNAPKKKAKPKGFWLEVLTGEHFDQSQSSYAEHFVAVLESVSRTYTNYGSYVEPPALSDPGVPGETLQTSMTIEEFQDFMEILNKTLEQAQEALVAEKEEASQIWHKLFGDEFPIVERVHSSTKASSILFSDNEFSSTEKFLYRDYGILPRLNGHPIKITCESSRRGFRTEHFQGKKATVRRGHDLIFRIIGIDTIRQPYTIMWKVKNTDEEARLIRELRGEISTDYGSFLRKETARYRGIHYVECYIVRNGYCIAKDRMYVEIN